MAASVVSAAESKASPPREGDGVCRRRSATPRPVVFVIGALFLSAIAALPTVDAGAEFRREPIVASWAHELGEKLYRLSQTVTRAEQIEAKYLEMGARVEEKDPKQLLDQIVERIDGMLQRKAEAVKCIVEKVEVLAERLHSNSTNSTERASASWEEFAEAPAGEGAKSRGRRDGGAEDEGSGGEEEKEDDESGGEDDDDVLIEFSYHSAKCSQVEILLDEPEVVNGSLYREDNATCENDGIYRPMRLKVDRHFYNIPINDTHSAVHVPTNVYDQAPKLLKLISMSEGLDEVFVKNYHSDPSLSWQYFGSAAGYLRHFPAMRWKSDPDLFDCRGRPWYVEAASACTKSAVVLVDTTGSMTGMRYSIARLTTGALLETFAPNDMVAVIKFSETPEELVPCFKDTLVPATRENIIAFKQALADAQDHTEGYANFTAAFERAFELFEINRASRGDCSPCGPIDNEVLFLVTDNVPGNWSWLLNQYNSLNSPLAMSMRRNNNESYSLANVTVDEIRAEALVDSIVSDADSMSTLPPLMMESDVEDILPPVRIVAFLIGKEVFNIKEIEKFTCENRGFSRNLQSLDEVKEEVLEYVPLLARPLAYTSGERDYPRPIVWTHTFADVSDPKVSRWLWEVMKNDEQKERFDVFERNKKMFFNQEEEDHRYVKKRRKEDDESLGYEYQEYRLMTSVSSPAFIHRTVNASNETEVVAELLGVAGTDVPIDEFLELLHLYEIGANGYGFAGTTEGNILFHPDLRPVFQGSLKDGFNSVDIAEIELPASEKSPRDFPEELLRLRNGMINQESGEMLGVDVLMHHDDMRRVTNEVRNYYYTPLPGTPYTITLSLPSTYGLFKLEVKDKEEIERFKKQGQTAYFNDDNWKVHSDWVYCKYLSEAFHLFESHEERLQHFLEKIRQPNWEWTKSDVLFSAADPNTHCRHTELAKDEYLCDKTLIELLLFDARLTNSFFRTKEWRLDSAEEKELFHIFNVTLRFMATHSGLTRWQQSSAHGENSTHKYFVDHYKNTIDEYWYKLSVIQHESDPGSYVYTLPYPRGGEGEAEDDNDLVNHLTVSRAIFLGEDNKTAPASVVGYQFPQTSLQNLLEEVTSDHSCDNGDNTSACAARKSFLSGRENAVNESEENFLFSSSSESPSCTSEEVIIYIIDGSGYILAVTDKDNNTDNSTQRNIGKFFGEVEPDVMSELVEVGLYSRHPLFDYQGLCVEEFITSGASFLLTPFYGLKWVFQWAIGQFVWILLKTNLHSLLFPTWAEAAVDAYYDNYDDPGVLVPLGKGGDEEDEVVLKDWRGRPIEKDDDYKPKNITTIVHESCDKWAYRFSLTPPPPPPVTVAPLTTLGYNGTDLFDDSNSTMSNYSSGLASSTASVTDALIHQNVWNRWRRSEPSTVPPSSTTDQPYNETQPSTSEDYGNGTRMGFLGDAENVTVCSKPFTAERIPHSDMVLVVVTNSESCLKCIEVPKEEDELDQDGNSSNEEQEEEYWSPDGSEMHVELKEIHYNDTHVCHKFRTGKLPRGKRVNTCITQHPKERLSLLTCRGCATQMPNILLMVLTSLMILMNKKWYLVAS
ncbi:voltage-dependent calcium channel unc-36-like isoform X2 [Ischnura elegans]|uniref:voltage-dependent calcium channel unc-36-like isoform X2 n=1 Tax=Ischnura elegans TaxID=197161 RepID=UPI001ED88520|nr:voltage-dependent calcium channel unc-36-like isoform X2 [Ischnura elegans]